MVSNDFSYNKKTLFDLGFIMAKPSEDDGSGLGKEILKGTTNLYRNQVVHYGAVYNDVITLSLFIIKFDCDNNDMMEISTYELRKIQAWLTSPKTPRPLYITTQEGDILEYNGMFTEISPYSVNGLNGLNLKFMCDSPYAYGTQNIKMNTGGSTKMISKTIYCDTDETEDYIYPLIYYHPNSAGEISFKNHTDNENIMKLKLNKKYNEIIIDCRLKRIIADGTPLSLHDVGFNIKEITDFNNINTGIYKMNWFRLLPKKNVVDFNINGNIRITYKNLLKLGGLVNV